MTVRGGFVFTCFGFLRLCKNFDLDPSAFRLTAFDMAKPRTGTQFLAEPAEATFKTFSAFQIFFRDTPLRDISAPNWLGKTRHSSLFRFHLARHSRTVVCFRFNGARAPPRAPCGALKGNAVPPTRRRVDSIGLLFHRPKSLND